MKYNNLYNDILQWHLKTFKNVSLFNQLKKLIEEIKECNKEFSLEELADIFIVSVRLNTFYLGKLINYFLSKYITKKYINRYNISEIQIRRAIKNKMEINKKRKWKLIDGVYRHYDN